MARGSVIRRVGKDGRPSYAIKYRDASGRQRWKTIGPTKKAAERALTEQLNALNQGTYRELKEATLASFAEQWLASAATRVKPSTLEGYGRAIRCHLEPAFGDYPLRGITTGLIEHWVSQELEAGQAPKSVNNYLTLLKKMLKDAVAWGYLALNPATDVARVRVPHQEMQALTPEQVRRLLEAVSPEHWLLFTTAVLTGVRRGELLALQWGDLDLQSGRLHVRRSLWRRKFIGPKTARAVRSVDLAPQLTAAFREAKPVVPEETLRTQLIFSGPNGRPLDPDNLVKRHFLPALERAELPRIRFHDLRHTFASLLIAAGEHPKAVQAQLGHSSITTTIDRYGHLLPGAFQHAGKRLEQTVLGGEALPRP